MARETETIEGPDVAAMYSRSARVYAQVCEAVCEQADAGKASLSDVCEVYGMLDLEPVQVR